MVGEQLTKDTIRSVGFRGSGTGGWPQTQCFGFNTYRPRR